MEAYYDLWDVDTGNSLGTYDTEAEALRIARLLIEAYGTDYAEMLDLGYSDEQGEGRSIASGAMLLDRIKDLTVETVSPVGVGGTQS